MTNTKNDVKKAGRVVHISMELHDELSRCARLEKVTIKEWTESILWEAINQEKIPAFVPPPKKKLESGVPDESSGPKPWERPPFWEGGQRGDDKAQKGEDQLEEEMQRADDGAGVPAYSSQRSNFSVDR